MAEENEQDTPDGADEPTVLPPAPEYPAAPPPPPGGYAGLGAMPAPTELDRPTPRPPTPVLISFWIWILNAVLSIVGGILTVANRNEIMDQLRNHPPQGISPSQYDSVVNTSIGISVVVAVVFAGLYVLFGYKVRAGKNWARTTLTVLTVLGVLYDLYVGASVATDISTLVSVIAVGLLYMPAAREFFAANRVPRQ